MFLTISMFWQWQNKQHFFFSRQILNPQAAFLKWHSNIVTADFVLLFHCWFGMSYWQMKSIHGDWVMRTRISEQPGTDHLLKADDHEEQPANVLLWYCKIGQGISFVAKTNGCWLTLKNSSHSARFCSWDVQNSVHMGSEIHPCAVGSAQESQISLLL